MANLSPVQVGDRAPTFILPNQSGALVNLVDWLGQKPIVLYFYPKDDTPGSPSRLAPSGTVSYEIFQETGAEVIGVSADTSASHQQFANRHASLHSPKRSR